MWPSASSVCVYLTKVSLTRGLLSWLCTRVSRLKWASLSAYRDQWMCVCDGVCVHTLIYIPGGEPSTLSCICTICVKLMSLYSHCMMWERTYVCVSVCMCVCSRRHGGWYGRLSLSGPCWSQTEPPAAPHSGRCSSSWSPYRSPGGAQMPGCLLLNRETEMDVKHIWGLNSVVTTHLNSLQGVLLKCFPT